MKTSSYEIGQHNEIPPHVVREIAQSQPYEGDFRAQFPIEQPALSEFITDHLEEVGEVAIEFAHRLGAALWAMYLEVTDHTFPPLKRDQLEPFVPIARELLVQLTQRISEEQEFDAEWLMQLPKGAQPHVMGFVIGALRASRLQFSGNEIFEIAIILFALAGALEGVLVLKNATI